MIEYVAYLLEFCSFFTSFPSSISCFAMVSSVALTYFPLFGVLYILAISTYSLMLTLMGMLGNVVISASPS